MLPGLVILLCPEPVTEQGGAGHRQPEEEGDEDALQRAEGGHDGQGVGAEVRVEEAVEQHAEGPEPVVQQQRQGDQGEAHHLLAPEGGEPVLLARDETGLGTPHIGKQQRGLQQARKGGAPGGTGYSHGLGAEMAEDEGIVEDDVGDDGDDADAGRRRGIAHRAQGRLQGHHHGGAEDGGAGDHQELVGQLAQRGLLAGKPEHAAR